MLELVLKTLLGYLIGSLNGSLLLGKILGGPDVRTLGSGNAGGTNALRTRGKKFALAVMIIDIGKGYLAVACLPGMQLPGLMPGGGDVVLALASAGAVIVGHCYPLWFGFAGGKGAATAVGALLALAPDLALPGLVTWLLVVGVTGFVGLATILAAAVLPLVVVLTGFAERSQLFFFLLLLTLFIVYTHRANVLRMLRHEENRMSALMFLRRRS